MRTYILAVSGGVDSVVLLDKLSKQKDVMLIVAHFDHGIRSDSADDAQFVKDLTAKYDLKFETKREELGAGASEELARDRRYEFLRHLAKRYKAKIITAHHGDDVVETIAINLIRGTGWRGLAVLDSADIERPLLHETKKDLITYAKKRKLEWREDSTNSDTKYLRNDIRQKLASLDDETKELLRRYRERQLFLRQAVDTEIGNIVQSTPYARYLFVNVDSGVASELLRGVLMQETGQSFTRPQLTRALLAIKTLQPGRTYEVGTGVSLRFTRTDFVVLRTGEVVS